LGDTLKDIEGLYLHDLPQDVQEAIRGLPNSSASTEHAARRSNRLGCPIKGCEALCLLTVELASDGEVTPINPDQEQTEEPEQTEDPEQTKEAHFVIEALWVQWKCLEGDKRISRYFLSSHEKPLTH
jgi:hypothetical protein